MSNRDMTHQSFSFEKLRKVVNARVSFGAAGAPTLDGPNSKGVLGVTRNSAGNYTFQFGVSVNNLSQIDSYIKLLAVDWLPDVSYVSGVSTAAPGQSAVYRNDLNTGFNLAPPVQAALATSTAGGTFPTATQFFYKVTAVDANGNESLASNEQNVTTGAGATNSNTVNWAAVPGTSTYRVYRGTAAGAENVVYVVLGGNSTSFVDTNAASQASAASQIQARPPISQGAVTLQTTNGAGAATDPATGEAVFVQFDFGDSGAP